MRTLVTGGAGFIGSNLSAALLAEGAEVVVLDDLSTGHAENVPRGAELIEGDVGDVDVVTKAMAGCEVVFHHAAHRAVLRSVQHPLETNRTNITGTLTVLVSAHEAGVRRVVYASSSSVYGGAPELPTPESAPLVPRSPYAVSKLAGEQYCRVFWELFGLETVCLRYFNVYGPRQRPDSQYAAVIPLFIDGLRHGRSLEIHGDGRQSRSFTYVSDVVAANLRAAAMPAERCAGRAYNISGGKPHTLLELVGILENLLDMPANMVHTEPRAGDIRHSWAAIEAAARDLEHRPSVEFSEGLSRTLEWRDGAALETNQRQRRPRRRGHEADGSIGPKDGQEISGTMSAETITLADRLLTAIDDRSARVVIIGQGYVGLPVAMRATEVGFRVVGYDRSQRRVRELQTGRSPVKDVPADQLSRALQSGYRPTADAAALANFDVAVISVPTPLREGTPDLSFIGAAATDLVNFIRPGSLAVLESTTYPGTTEELMAPILERSGLKSGVDFFLGYSPERIDPGNRTWTLVNTPKVVSGIDGTSRRCVEAFYSTLVDKVVPVGTVAEAELVKLLENTFRHVNIALVNELAMFARDLGVDVWNAIEAASTKPFGYLRFTPGPGVGGHCLPIDPSYLSWRVRRRLGRTFRFVDLANDVNEHMPDYVVTRLIHLLNLQSRAVRATKVLLLGLAYKAGTSDWRESPSLAVAERLLALGADLSACDPYLQETKDWPSIDVPLVEFTIDTVADADVVVLLVDHPEFLPELVAKHARLVLDTRGVLRGFSFQGELL